MERILHACGRLKIKDKRLNTKSNDYGGWKESSVPAAS